MVRLALLLFAAAVLPAPAADPNKVFRYAFEIAETWKYIDIDVSKKPAKVARK